MAKSQRKPKKRATKRKAEVKGLAVKEFAKLCGTPDKPISMATVYSDINRSNIVRDSETKLIAPENPINKAYSEKKRGKAIAASIPEKEKADFEHKRLTIAKAEEDLKVSQLRRQKMEGEVIPTELVHRTFEVHFKSITQEFENGAEQIAIDLTKRLKGSRDDLAFAKGRVVKIINEAVTKARVMSKNDIKSIVEEYSQSIKR